jgi:hypothetical protein
LYNSTKGQIDNVSLTINFNAFPVYGVEVDKAAKSLLEDIVGVTATYTGDSKYQVQYNKNSNVPKWPIIGEEDFGYENHGATLDSNNYGYGILSHDAASRGTGAANSTLASAIDRTNAQN